MTGPATAILALAVTTMLLGGTAKAATSLDADPIDGNYEYSNFAVFFTDKNADGLLDFDEITVFTGMDQTSDPSLPVQLPYLYGIPTIAGFSTYGSAPGSNAPFGRWSFSSQRNGVIEMAITPDAWTYQIENISGPTPVPVPLPALLLAGALAGLAAVGRAPSDARSAG